MKDLRFYKVTGFIRWEVPLNAQENPLLNAWVRDGAVETFRHHACAFRLQLLHVGPPQWLFMEFNNTGLRWRIEKSLVACQEILCRENGNILNSENAIVVPVPSGRPSMIANELEKCLTYGKYRVRLARVTKEFRCEVNGHVLQRRIGSGWHCQGFVFTMEKLARTLMQRSPGRASFGAELFQFVRDVCGLTAQKVGAAIFASVVLSSSMLSYFRTQT